MTVIRTAAELALRHPRSPESHRQTLEAIQRETEQMTGLIEQLLLLARGDAGQWQFHFDSVFADAVLRHLQKVISSLAESKHIQMDWTLPDQPMIVWADELALRRLVMILADNALKFTPSADALQFGCGLWNRNVLSKSLIPVVVSETRNYHTFSKDSIVPIRHARRVPE